MIAIPSLVPKGWVSNMCYFNPVNAMAFSLCETRKKQRQTSKGKDTYVLSARLSETSCSLRILQCLTSVRHGLVISLVKG
jgi:hypothetical protein